MHILERQIQLRARVVDPRRDLAERVVPAGPLDRQVCQRHQQHLPVLLTEDEIVVCHLASSPVLRRLARTLPHSLNPDAGTASCGCPAPDSNSSGGRTSAPPLSACRNGTAGLPAPRPTRESP